MDIRQLRHFLALADTLNFHRAAERLHMAQPPLSASIRRLEAQLGVELFSRNRRGTELTAAGVAAVDDARRAVFHAEQFARTAQAAARGESGVLRVGFVGSATYALMPRVLPRFRARYPGVQLQLGESTTARIVAMVESGDVDVGLVRFPLGRAGRVRVFPAERDVFMAALSVDHPLARRRRVALADLAQEPFVMYGADAVPGLHAAALLACQQAGFVPDVHQEAVQVQTLISLVESGMGVALVPSVAARHTTRAVAFRPLSGPGAQTAIGIAIALPPQGQTSAAQRFLESVLEGVSGTVSEGDLPG
ncbi:LysR family transcriptional regulator [uncultured Xylophilus sp.]|uniref:LysR family transcriptional regulator n=1 Tax=uncultured Xylophilus sp. TaxID=296832 RepID=UPI0025DE6815|nr:LysR family transcriptional regulator [uncultured Xylophilus sp.]